MERLLSLSYKWSVLQLVWRGCTEYQFSMAVMGHEMGEGIMLVSDSGFEPTPKPT